MNRGAPVLSLRDVAVSAGGVALLHEISLELGPGEMVALRGPSGAGKSTLLRAVAGLVDPTAGDVALEGRSAAEVGWPAFRRRVVLVDQESVVLPGTVRDNLARPFAYRSSPGAFPEARARELLDRILLGADRLPQEARSLSVGQRQRLALARALLLDPAVLLLDEPTSALDAEAAQAVEALLIETAAAGVAALIVTHGQEQARRLCVRTLDLAPHRAVREAAVA